MFRDWIDQFFNKLAGHMFRSTLFSKHTHEAGDHTHADYMAIALQNQIEIRAVKLMLATNKRIAAFLQKQKGVVKDENAWV